MKKKFMKKAVAAAVAASVLVLGLAGCTNGDTDSGKGNGKSLTGTITMAGSTSMEKLSNALAEAFMEQNGGVRVTAEFTGSSAGLESLGNGTADIGNASRALSEEEKSKGAVENVVAIDGIAVILDKENSAVKLTKEQMASIYKGEINNWKDVGGSDAAIVVIGREAGSGTRDAFEELLDIKDVCEYANELDSTGAVLAKVAATKGAIGYVSIDVLDDSINAVTLDGMEPTEENILSGSYLLSRPFVMAAKGGTEKQSELVQAFFNFIKSEDGQAVIKGVGLILPQ